VAQGGRGGDRPHPLGRPLQASALRAYQQALRTKLLAPLGHRRLSAITSAAIQDVVDRLVADGHSASTVRNAVLPLRAIYRRALSRSEVFTNPTQGLSLPAVRGRRGRVARAAEAHALVEALPEADRAIWATALYAGLRCGELQALRWQDVDFERTPFTRPGSRDARGPFAVRPKTRLFASPDARSRWPAR